MTDDQATRLLEVHLVGDDAVSAAQVAAILTTLDVAFRQFCSRRGPRGSNASLAVVAVNQGCIRILLDAIDGAGKLWEARELLAPFATSLMDAAKLLISGGVIRPAERKALAAISAPVASSGTQVNLVNNGTIHFSMNEAMATAVIDAMRSPEKASSVVPATSSPSPQLLSEHQARALESDGMEGAAVAVDDEWYARLIDGRGVLIPLLASIGIRNSLVHRGLYRFRGTVVSGRRGEPVAIEVREVTRIGAA